MPIATLWPPFQSDDLDLDVVSARSQLVELLSHHSDWLLTTSQRFLPGAALNGLDGITDHKEKVSVLLDLLEEAGPATWEQFVQCLCMECDLPLDLEIQVMSSAREGSGQVPLSPNTANALARRAKRPA